MIQDIQKGVPQEEERPINEKTSRITERDGEQPTKAVEASSTISKSSSKLLYLNYASFFFSTFRACV